VFALLIPKRLNSARPDPKRLKRESPLEISTNLVKYLFESSLVRILDVAGSWILIVARAELVVGYPGFWAARIEPNKQGHLGQKIN